MNKNKTDQIKKFFLNQYPQISPTNLLQRIRKTIYLTWLGDFQTYYERQVPYLEVLPGPLQIEKAMVRQLYCYKHDCSGSNKIIAHTGDTESLDRCGY